MTESTPPPRFTLEGTITINTAGPVDTSGAFCDLFTGTHPIAGKVALKKPRGTLCTNALMRLIEIEAGVWIKLNHPRILKFLGLYTVDEVIYFVSPFAEFGSLPSYLVRFPDADRGRLIVEIAEGLAYLHQFEPGIIHGDVKGHNVLIASDHHARLCDFGLARHADARTATALKGAGSLPWQSPEILGDGVSKSLQSDVYAFGITIYEILSGKVPYCDCPTPGNIIKGVVFSNLRPPLEPPAASDGTSYMRFWVEATKCWAENPAERPSMADVLRALSNPIVEPETVTSQPSTRNGSQEDVSSLARTGLVGGSRTQTSFQADVISAPKRKAEAVDTSTLRASKRHRLSGQTAAAMPHHLGAVSELHVSSSTAPEVLSEPQRTSSGEPPEMDDQQIPNNAESAESHFIGHYDDDLGECEACGSDFDLDGYCVGCGASADLEYFDEDEVEEEDAASDGDSGSSSECEECGSDFDLEGYCVGCGNRNDSGRARHRLSASPPLPYDLGSQVKGIGDFS